MSIQIILILVVAWIVFGDHILKNMIAAGLAMGVEFPEPIGVYNPFMRMFILITASLVTVPLAGIVRLLVWFTEYKNLELTNQFQHLNYWERFWVLYQSSLTH